MKNQLISIILPIHNQADHIRSVITEYEEKLSVLPLQYEILLVLNGCRDDSLAVCQDLKNKFSSVRIIETKRSGWGLAVKLGIKEARGDVFCYTNSSRTQAKDLILFLLYALANPETVIKANRKIRESLTRRIGSLLYNIECRTLFDLTYWDINGTPKVFPRKYDKLLQLSREDDLIDLEFNLLCRQAEYPILEIPTFSPKRSGGKSTTRMGSALKMYWGALKMKLDYDRREKAKGPA